MWEYTWLQLSHCRCLCPLRWYIRHYIFLPIDIPPCNLCFIRLRFFCLIFTSALESSPFELFRFFLSGKSIISYLIFENWLEEAERKYTEIYLSLLKYTQIISKSQNILWIFIVLSQNFCAWTICKHLCDIVLFCIFGKCWYLFFSFVIYLFSALYVHYAIIGFSELAFFFRNGNVTKDC